MSIYFKDNFYHVAKKIYKRFEKIYIINHNLFAFVQERSTLN